MRIFLVAGEKSGDDHASKVMQEIKRQNPNTEFQFWGGDAMEEVSPGGLLKHYKNHAYMGVLEVIKNLRAIFRNLKLCKQQIEAFNPEVLVLVDYPGFNLRIAKFAKLLGIKTVYFIAPQLWAWKKNRYKIIKQWVDELCVILPFEKPFFKALGVASHYVGHPLLEEVSGTVELGHKIALLPGSRVQELERMLPLFQELAELNPDKSFLVCGVKSMPIEMYNSILSLPNVEMEFGGMKACLGQCQRALVTSGTATLESALYGIPLAVVYKTSGLTYRIAKMLIKVKYISLVNLILDRPAVPEFIQDEANIHNLNSWLNDAEVGVIQANMFKELKDKLSVNTKASEAVANVVLNA
ncbi:MAG: lipid-A-disaccharide synthase [Luteibaculaceae bacterium]|jgi:lipid-A-disaccharide synthase